MRENHVRSTKEKMERVGSGQGENVTSPSQPTSVLDVNMVPEKHVQKKKDKIEGREYPANQSTEAEVEAGSTQQDLVPADEQCNYLPGEQPCAQEEEEPQPQQEVPVSGSSCEAQAAAHTGPFIPCCVYELHCARSKGRVCLLLTVDRTFAYLWRKRPVYIAPSSCR